MPRILQVWRRACRPLTRQPRSVQNDQAIRQLVARMGGGYMLAERLATGLDAFDKPLHGPTLADLFGKTADDGRAGAGIEVTLDPLVDQDLHMPLRLADENQHPRGSRGALQVCLLYTSPSPRDQRGSRMPSSA